MNTLVFPLQTPIPKNKGRMPKDELAELRDKRESERLGFDVRWLRMGITKEAFDEYAKQLLKKDMDKCTSQI